MDQLLHRVTALDVQVIQNGVLFQPDTVYLIPPNTKMVITNGRLLLTERSVENGFNYPFDQLLRSLAQG